MHCLLFLVFSVDFKGTGRQDCTWYFFQSFRVTSEYSIGNVKWITVEAGLQDAPNESHLLVFMHLCSPPQQWIELASISNKILWKWSFFFTSKAKSMKDVWVPALLILSGRSQTLCHGDTLVALWRGSFSKELNHLLIAHTYLPLSAILELNHLAPIQTSDDWCDNTLTLPSKETLNQYHQAKPLPNTWPTETLRQ